MRRSKLHYEKECFALGYLQVAGVDEVGMGCLAGPVVAVAVILNPAKIPKGIDDSKKLSQKKREALNEAIQATALCWALGSAEAGEIDTLNIYQAARLAMRRAVQALTTPPDFLLVDGRAQIECAIAQKAIIGGDGLSVSVGAASILAKVYRDAWMRRFDVEYPGYEFAKHKGYGTREHRRHLQERGPTPLHRKSFSWGPV